MSIKEYKKTHGRQEEVDVHMKWGSVRRTTTRAMNCSFIDGFKIYLKTAYRSCLQRQKCFSPWSEIGFQCIRYLLKIKILIADIYFVADCGENIERKSSSYNDLQELI